MNFPENLWYTRDHEWIKFENDEALIGITDFAQHELGDIVYVDIPAVKGKLSKEDVFGTVEAVKTVSDLFMPVGGKIIGTNPELEISPEMINTNPYDAWMIRIRLSDPDEHDWLLTAQQYRELIGKA